MIKVTCKDRSDPEKPTYPCLKITEKKRIVLFTGPKTGYELNGGPDSTWLFYHSERWVEDNFLLYNGVVELSNG